MVSEEKHKIVFSDLSSPLKVAVIAAYTVAVVWLLLFLAGFMVGVAETV